MWWEGNFGNGRLEIVGFHDFISLLSHGRGQRHDREDVLDGRGEFLKPQLREEPIVGRTVRDKGLEAGQKV